MELHNAQNANQNIDRQDKEESKLFVKNFVRVYRQHGGRVDTEPVMVGGNRDCAEAVTTLFKGINQTHGRYPQLMFFVLRGPNSHIYSRIKKSADCRYGVVSQCVQSSHLRKSQDQYLSNVCMKVNAKLGGTTSQVRVSSTSLLRLPLTQLLIVCDSQLSAVAAIFRPLP